MPQFTSFAINDGSATPVAVTFSPELLSSAQMVLVDRRKAVRDQQPTLTYSFDRPVPARPKTYKVGGKLAYPIVGMAGGVEVVTDTARAEFGFVLPVTMTQADRKHLRAFLRNALDQALIRAGIEDLDPTY